MNNLIKRVWNRRGMTHIEDLQGFAFSNESGGHTFQISGVEDGTMVVLSGTVAASFLRPDQATVAITGSISGGVVSVTLPANCYDIPGRFGLVIFLTSDGQKTAIYSCVGNVARSSTSQVAPGTTADVVDLINQINAAVATIPQSWTGLMADIAPTYSASAVYPVGAYVYYNGDLYRCTTAITTAESWTAGHWTAAVLGNDLVDLKSAFSVAEELIQNERSGKYYSGYAVGNTLPTVPNAVTTAGIYLSEVAVSEGDVITLNAKVGNMDKVIFLDSDRKIISRSTGGEYANYVYTVPSGISTLVIQSSCTYDRMYCYRGVNKNGISYKRLESVVFEQGGLNSSGEETDSTKRVRSEFIYLPAKSCICVPADNLLSSVKYYDDNKHYLGTTDLARGTTWFTSTDSAYVRLLFGKDISGTQETAPSDITFGIYTLYTDDCINTFGKEIADIESGFESRFSPINYSEQINDGLTQTSADGATLVYDKKYGITYNVYMPGARGAYGESRGKIALTYFPTTQPENQITVEIATGNQVYCPNAVLVEPDVIRCYYQRNSTTLSDHTTCYKDYNIATHTLSEEHECGFVFNGSTVALNTNNVLAYLATTPYTDSSATAREPIGLQGCTIFKRADTGYLYCSLCNDDSYPVLCYSDDNGITWTPFAVYPHKAQYEFAFAYLNGTYYALCRTSGTPPTGSVFFTKSSDNGATWSTPVAVANSIQCRPRVIAYQSGLLFACNIYNTATGYRPSVQQGRTEIEIWWDDGTASSVAEMTKVASLHSIYGIVNIALMDVVGTVYLAFSTSVQALEYQNGDSPVRGKDSIRFANLGYLKP